MSVKLIVRTVLCAIEVSQVDLDLHSSLSSLGVPNNPWEIVGMDFVTDLPKSSKFNFTSILILVCHLTKMDHFVPYHKEITSKESIDLFMNNCYKLHGVP